MVRFLLLYEASNHNPLSITMSVKHSHSEQTILPLYPQIQLATNGQCWGQKEIASVRNIYTLHFLLMFP